MPDQIIARPGFRDVNVRYVDMADTSFAEKVVVVNADGTPITTGASANVAKATAAAPTYIEGSNVQVSVDLAGRLRVSLPAGGGGLTDTELRATPVPVSFGGGVDVTDRAARLVGVVYGSQGQQVKQTATNFNLAAEVHVGATAIDPRSIRALTSSDVVDVSDRAARALGVVASITAAVGVTDNGGSLTVDAPVATPVAVRLSDGAAFYNGLKAADTLTAVTTVTSLTQMNGAAISMNTGVRDAGTQRVTIATNDVVPVTGTFWQATQPTDPIDRAARLVGRVYGSQGNQILQTATNFNTQVEVAVGATLIDPRSIRALTAADVVSAQVTSVIPGTGATNLGKAEDSAHVSGDTGVAVLFVRNDVYADLTNADLDYGFGAVDIKGRQTVREINELVATTVSTANATVTLTIAAAGVGLFHYIKSVEIVNVNPTAAAIAGSAVTLTYTTTNIPGAPAWTEGNALAAGASKVVTRRDFSGGIKTTTANTATTVVAPAIGAGGLVRILVTYYIAQ